MLLRALSQSGILVFCRNGSAICVRRLFFVQRNKILGLIIAAPHLHKVIIAFGAIALFRVQHSA